MVGDMLHDFTADDSLEMAVGKRQAADIGRRQAPATAAVLSQPVVVFEALTGLLKIFAIEVRPHGDDTLQAIGLRGMAAVAAADVEHMLARFESQASKIGGNHR